MKLEELANVRPSGMIAIGLDEGDFLGWARLTTGKDDVLLITAGGQALRIHETVIRPQGRPGSGVSGIKLDKGDKLASMEIIEPGGCLLVLTEYGYGKRTPLNEFTVKGRSTGGVATAGQKNLDRTGRVAVARVVQENDEITAITAGGMVVRLKVKDISVMGRGARGMRVMDVIKGDMVASLARIPAEGVELAPDGEDHSQNNGG